VRIEPTREPVAVPVPRDVRESSWDMHHAGNRSPGSGGTGSDSNGSHGTNDSNEADDRRHASVAPDGSAWS